MRVVYVIKRLAFQTLLDRWFMKSFLRQSCGMVSGPVSSEMLSQTCRSNLVGE
ncbi:hypothetical protein AVEN_176225-1, partial [Araneus ventricosus]